MTSKKRGITLSEMRKKARSYESDPKYSSMFVRPRYKQLSIKKEAGYVDLAGANYTMNTTGTVTLLATIPQGTSVNQRVGKKIVYKSLQCRGYVHNDTTAVYNDCAIIIVYDRQPTGSLPAITDILDTANAISFNNDANSDRFKILKRMDFALVGPLTGTIATQQPTSTSALSADFYLSLKNLSAQFKAAGTGAIGDISNGALYLVTVGITAAGTGDANAVLGFRTRFIDI